MLKKAGALVLLCLISAGITLLVLKAVHFSPNVIFITVGSLRTDWLGCYGGRKADTAQIDRFAAQSLVFTSVWTPSPDTVASLCSLLTGVDPVKRGEDGKPEPDRSRALPLLLKTRDYYTAGAMGALFYDPAFEPFRDLFDEVIKSPDISVRFYRARLLNEGVIPWIKKNARRKQPFFLWVHYDDPEMFYDPPSPYFEHYSDPVFKAFPQDIYSSRFRETYNRYVTSLYAGEITYLDRQIGHTLKALEKAGLAKRSIIVLAGEHGETLTERPFTFCHDNLYEEVLKVPLVMKLPGRMVSGSKTSAKIKTPGTLADVYHTLCSLTELGTAVEGKTRNLLKGSHPPSASMGRSFVFKWEDRLAAVRKGPFKLIIPLKKSTHIPLLSYLPPTESLQWDPEIPELYDLREDPFELRNLAGRRPDLVNELKQVLDNK